VDSDDGVETEQFLTLSIVSCPWLLSQATVVVLDANYYVKTTVLSISHIVSSQINYDF
jgi:hypothetical protein